MTETNKKETKLLGGLQRSRNTFITSRRQALFNRQSVQEDTEAAKKGNLEAFFRLIEFRKTTIFELWARSLIEEKYFFDVVRPGNGTGSLFFEKLGNAISNNIKFPPYERLEGQVRLACEGRDLNHRGTIKGIFKHLNEKHEQALELGEIQEDDPAFKILDDEDYFRKFLQRTGIHKPYKKGCTRR